MRAGSCRARFLLAILLFLAIYPSSANAQTGDMSARQGSVSSQNNDAACAEYGQSLLENYGSLGLQPNDVAVISNCFVDRHGNWFMAIGPQDSRLESGSILSAEQASKTNQIRTEIEADVNAILGWAATVPARSIPPAQANGKSFRTELEEQFSPVPLPITGHLRTDVVVDAAFYGDYLLALATSPDHLTLRSYLLWQADRVKSLQVRVCGSNPRSYLAIACTNALKGPYPYPARLLDDLLLAEFSLWVVENS